MLGRSLFKGREPRRRIARGPAGKRCYAVGDIHGRLDLLRELVGLVEKDVASREPKETVIVFVGDLMDRGPDSRGVIEFLMDFAPPYAKAYKIKGNHEEMMIRCLTGEPHLLESWLENGGYACAQSYGVQVGALYGQEASVVEEALVSAVPKHHVEFLKSFIECVRFGDYFITHAGVRPGVPLDTQAASDMRWISDEFLASRADHGAVVVHGHSVSEAVDERQNRIGIDTGAYRTGVLTALRLEDDQRGVLQTSGGAGDATATGAGDG
ncbi:MAG: serine/threonine protein phosphatase [Caulobacterales bacterium]|nr:serine/threonine protein phosphatase [Caulobacterales bacterium]